MKFEEKLEQSIRRVWEEHYIDYEAMKKVLNSGQTPEIRQQFHEL